MCRPRLVLLSLLVALAAGCGGSGVAAPPATVVPLEGAVVPVAQVAAPSAAASDEPEPGTAIPVTRADPQRGSPLAPVTLVVFGDFQCPYTAKHFNTLGDLSLRYGERGLRIVWKDYPLPFHKEARPAAIAAETVFRMGGDGAFWAFARQALVGMRHLDEESFARWASDADVHPGRFRDAFAAGGHAAAVDADIESGGRVLVRGTPASFVNGVFLSGAQPIEKFMAVIDEQTEVARREVEGGLAADRVYAVLSDRQHAESRARAAAAPPKSPAPAPTPQVAGAERFGARHLVIMYEGAARQPPGVTRTQPEALALATSVAAMARRGDAFEDLVVKYSDEPGAADRGGDLGTFPRNAMVPEFQAAVEALQVGEVSGVVETKFGYHVIVRTQ